MKDGGQKLTFHYALLCDTSTKYSLPAEATRSHHHHHYHLLSDLSSGYFTTDITPKFCVHISSLSYMSSPS
jgi:hypothetical protein